MAFVEYLYIDHKRIDSYIEQIRSPITFDKVPKWQAAVTLTGPKVEAGQDVHARKLTSHEKVAALLDYLQREELIYKSKPTWRDYQNDWDRLFVLERIDAKKHNIPPKTKTNLSYEGLNLWISIASTSDADNPLRTKDLLVLIEDFNNDDTTCGRFYTGYTILATLLYELHEEIRKTVLADSALFKTFMADQERKSKESGQWFLHLVSEALAARISKPSASTFPNITLDDANESIASYMKMFIHNPGRVLQLLGCRPGVDRSIEVLYRLRTLGFDYADSCRTLTIVGYPIVIWGNR